MLVKLLQFLNVLALIAVTPLGTVRVPVESPVNLLQPSNADAPIVPTCDGIVKLVKPLQPSNAEAPIVVSELFAANVTLSSLLPENA